MNHHSKYHFQKWVWMSWQQKNVKWMPHLNAPHTMVAILNFVSLEYFETSHQKSCKVKWVCYSHISIKSVKKRRPQNFGFTLIFFLWMTSWLCFHVPWLYDFTKMGNGQMAESPPVRKKIDNVFFRRGAAVATMLLRFPRGASIVVQCRYAGLSHPPPFFSSQHRPLCHSLAKKKWDAYKLSKLSFHILSKNGLQLELI